LTDHISLGVLTGLVHHDLVDDVLVETGRVEKRSRKLPARVMVYFTLAMWLFFDDERGGHGEGHTQRESRPRHG
jgi:hypothetical protein